MQQKAELLIETETLWSRELPLLQAKATSVVVKSNEMGNTLIKTFELAGLKIQTEHHLGIAFRLKITGYKFAGISFNIHLPSR